MNKTVYFALYLMILGMLVTAIAYGGFKFTETYIEANKIERINNSIALLYSPEDGYKRNENQEENKYREEEEKRISAIYEVLNADDELVAIIYDVNADGRNATVYALIAVDPYTDEIVGVTYYDHQETPNLGERYTRDEEIDKLIGETITSVTVDQITGATKTWDAITFMFGEISEHYTKRGVHIDG
jgi:Na+-transporting NADH:ubiquinone oxidoreductase subunit C